MINFIRRLMFMDLPTAFIFIFTVISVILVGIFHGKYKEKKVLRVVVPLMPFAGFAIFMALFYTKGNVMYSLIKYGWLGVITILTAIWSFIGKSRKARIISTFFLYITSSVCVVLGLISTMTINGSVCFGNFTHEGWTESFNSTIDELEKNYVLRDWKNIDFEKLRTELIPKVEKAEKENDLTEFAMALNELKYNLYDGHTCVVINDEQAFTDVNEKIAGNDYGFSMYTIDSGETIAVVTDNKSRAYELGIHDGTVITAWDGEPIDKALENVQCKDAIYTYAIEENEHKFRPIYLAGMGGDSINVSFIDDSGSQRNEKIDKTGCYLMRKMKAISSIYAKEKTKDENFTVKMLNDNCGYLRISSEMYNNTKDIQAYLKGDYPEMRELISKKLDELKAQGMDRLIIDSRNNDGGFSEISMAVASMFNKEPIELNSGIYKSGKYKNMGTQSITGAGRWSNLQVTVLVNGECCSSGDILAYLLSQCPNVTLMGITTTWGCAQETGGVCMLSDSKLQLWYPVIATLDENDSIMIDAKSDRAAFIRLDERIPVDRDAALQIFGDSDTDYELDYALSFIEK